MGFINLISAGFSWLTGNSNSANKAVDAVINSGDALVFTDEEKDNSNHKKLDFIIRHAEATQSQSVSRRVLTVSIAFLFITLSVVVVVAGYFDRSIGSYSTFVFDFMKEVVLQPFSILLVFYFVTPFAKKKEKVNAS